MTGTSTVGIALGGGGVRGLAHVAALQTIDACGITPKILAGTSMGAIIGALYASGRSGRQIRDLVEQHSVTQNDGLRDLYAKKRGLLKWLHAVRLSWEGSGLLKADGFLQYLIEQMEVDTFEGLKIPLRVVATDFYSGAPVVFDSGPLFPALKASMSIPGVFVPVELDGRILVDGGMSNNLPYDLVADECDITIAIDVAPTRVREDAEPPNMLDATLGMFDILVEHITRAMIEARPPTIYVHPRLVGIRILEFDEADAVFEQALPAMVDLEKRIRELLPVGGEGP